MNVARIELCKELHELSGWDDTGSGYVPEYEPDEPPITFIPENRFAYEQDHYDYYYVTKESDGFQVIYVPAYSLGYLLRKLPSDVTVKLYVDTVTMTGKRVYYFVGNFDKRLTDRFDTPEDAAAMLAIELFKQGVLKRED